MKTLFALALLSTTAQAATDLTCSSSPVDFEITSPAGLLTVGNTLTITANGKFTTTETARVDMVESAAPPLAVIDLSTLDTNGNEDSISSIRARLEIPLDANGVASGAGKLQITRVPALHPPRMLTRYDLNGCNGNL